MQDPRQQFAVPGGADRLSAGAVQATVLRPGALNRLEDLDPEAAGDRAFQLLPQGEAEPFKVQIWNRDRPQPLPAPARQDPLRWRRSRATVPSREMLVLEGAIYAGQGVVLDHDGRTFPGSFPRYDRPNDHGALVGGPAGLVVERDLDLAPRSGRMLSLGDAPDQFGHFLLETLSRLWAVEWAQARGLPVALLRSRPLHAWQEALLQAGGVDVARITLLAGPSRVERLFVPSADYDLHQGARPELREAHERVASHLAPDAAPPTRRVFLARGGSGGRRPFTNEGEIAGVFADRGFEVVFPERLPITEQVRLARESRILAGPIGSQMYLAMFQQQGGQTILLTPQGFGLPDDAILAGLRGGRARYILCPAEDGDERRPIDRAFYADPKVVAAALDGWLAERRPGRRGADLSRAP